MINSISEYYLSRIQWQFDRQILGTKILWGKVGLGLNLRKGLITFSLVWSEAGSEPGFIFRVNSSSSA